MASIVLPTKTKHPFMQICIGLDDEAGSNKEILLFLERSMVFQPPCMRLVVCIFFMVKMIG